MKCQLVEAFTKSPWVLARLLGFCAVFSKLTIAPNWEVQMILRLLSWKVDLIGFPAIHIMHLKT
jgi:hypothetical protein